MGILRLNCHKYLWIQVIKVAFQILNFIQVVTPNGYCIWKLEFDKSVFSSIFYLSCLYWLWAVCCRGCLLLNKCTVPSTIKPSLFSGVSKHHCNANKWVQHHSFLQWGRLVPFAAGITEGYLYELNRHKSSSWSKIYVCVCVLVCIWNRTCDSTR